MKKDIKQIFRLWAKGNVFMLRFAKYVQVLNLGLLARLFIKSFENKDKGILILLILVAVLVIVSLIDYRWVLGKEMGTIFEKNTEWKQLKKDIKEIKEKIK